MQVILSVWHNFKTASAKLIKDMKSLSLCPAHVKVEVWRKTKLYMFKR